MDSTGQGGQHKAAVIAAAFIILTACGQPGRVAPAPAPPPPIQEALPTTLPEIRALRTTGQLERYERALRAVMLGSDTSVRHKAEALLALHLYDQKRYGEAVRELETAAADNPLIAPFLRLRLIDAYDKLGSTREAIAVANAIISGTITIPLSPTAVPPATESSGTDNSAITIAKLRLPALDARAGDVAAATTALQNVTSVAIDELNESDFGNLADQLDKAAWTDAAKAIRMRLLREYPQGRLTEQVYSKLAEMKPSPLDAFSVEEATELASSLAHADRYDQALDLLGRYESRPGVSDDHEFQGVRLRALFYSRNYSQIVRETEGKELEAPDLLIRARAAWRSDRPDVFLAGLDELEKRFPTSREAIAAKVQRAKYYVTDEVDYDKSIANLSAAIEAGAAGSDGENLWNLGWTYYLAGRYDDALQTFARYVAAYPDGDWKTNSLFWTAKIQEKLGKIDARNAALQQIETEYPYSYYAYRAREIMGQPTVAPPEIANGAVFPDLDAELAKVTGPRIEAVRELLDVDLAADATREMKILAAEYPANGGVAFMLADVYLDAGEAFKANGVLQRRFRQFVRHGGSGISQRFWEILFPLHYWHTIQTEAEKRNLDPYLVASIIRQESGFEPTTVSNAGAVGLMQIMPAEASRIASAAGLPPVRREDLFDPAINIAIGVAEYSEKLNEMHGNPILAIAAYNAGEEAVGKWIAETPVGDIDLFVETIPYAETRLYVKSVTRNRFEYRRIYESSTAAQQTDQSLTPSHVPGSSLDRNASIR